MRKSIGAAVYPVRVVVDAPVRLWNWLGESTTSRTDLELELGRLQAERLLTNARLQKLNALEAENARLRAMLDARAQVRDRSRVAEIMSVDANPYDHSLVIDVGTQDGVFDGQALVDADGVVGQVIKAGLLTSQAMLISDTDHAFPLKLIATACERLLSEPADRSVSMLPFVVNNADISLATCWSRRASVALSRPVTRLRSSNRSPVSRMNPMPRSRAKPAASLGQVREVLLIFSRSSGHGGDRDE